MNKKENLQKRLGRISGQIRGVGRMLENDKYCIDIITQTSAIKSAISSLEDELLKSHLSHCVVDQVQHGKEKKAVEEILKVYKLKIR